jgi:hypothetical protein
LDIGSTNGTRATTTPNVLLTATVLSPTSKRVHSLICRWSPRTSALLLIQDSPGRRRQVLIGVAVPPSMST